MMVGRPVQLQVEKDEAKPGDVILDVQGMTVHAKNSKKNAVHDVSFQVRAGEIVCIAGIDGNGQTELVYGLTGLEKTSAGKVTLCGKDISHASVHKRSQAGLSHIPRTGTSTAWCWTTPWKTTLCCSPSGNPGSSTWALSRGRSAQLCHEDHRAV